MVVLLPLMSDSKHCDRLRIVDFEECDVTCRTEWNDELAQERPMCSLGRLAAGEGKFLQEAQRVPDGFKRAFGDLEIIRQQEVVEAQKVVSRLFGQSDFEHAGI